MALSEEARLLVKITAENASQRVLSQFNTQLKGLQTAAVGLGTALLGAFALRDVVDSTRRLGNEIDLLRDNLGLSAVEASRLNYAARVVGTSAEEVSAAFGALNRNLINQIPLLVKGESDFDKWGVTVRDASGDIMPLASVMENVRRRLAELPAGLERSGLAMDLMGRSGRQLIDLLTLTDKEFAALAEEADDLGLVLSEAGVDSLEDFNRNLNKLDLQMDALKLRIGQFLVPVLRELLNWLRSNTGAIKAFFEEVRKVAGAVKEFAAGIQAFVGKVKEKGLVGALIDEFRDRFPELAKIWDEWFAPGTGKIPKSFSDNGTELNRVWGPGGVVGQAFSGLGSTVRAAFDAIGASISSRAEEWGNAFSIVGTGARRVFDAIGGVIRATLDAIGTFFANWILDRINDINTVIGVIRRLPGGTNIPYAGGGSQPIVPQPVNPGRERQPVDIPAGQFPGGVIPEKIREAIRGGGGGGGDFISAASGFHGIVDRPTMFRAGEAGIESVDISPGGRRGGGISIGSIVINGNVDSRERVDELVNSVASRILDLAGSMGPLRYR